MPAFTSDTKYLYQSPIGAFGICIEHHFIRRLHFLDRVPHGTLGLQNANEAAEKNALLAKLCQALNGYFQTQDYKRLYAMSVYLDPNQGSVHDRRVWAFARSVHPGHLCHYGEAARALESSAQAVGQALKRNPCMLLTPCHRIVAKHGLGGFMGSANDTSHLKETLLRLEHAL